MATTRTGGSARRATVSAASPRRLRQTDVPCSRVRAASTTPATASETDALGRQDGWNQKTDNAVDVKPRTPEARPTRTSAPLEY